ncbi:MAG: hypothetical protein IV100_19475 [Myxococcales bacterium]|nr:hypothetical protein [Myxococcales bacterium]
MGRRFELPKATGRSPDAPAITLTRKQVLGLYNQNNREDPRARMCETVENWFVRFVTSEGWSGASITKDVRGVCSGAVLAVTMPHIAKLARERHAELYQPLLMASRSE